MNPLTRRQNEILQYMQAFSRDCGYWPSIRNIQDAFGFRSTNAVAGHLRALEEKGALVRIPGQARSYRINPALADDPDAVAPSGRIEVVEIPVYGNIAAGYPDGVERGDAIDRIQIGIDVIGSHRSARCFALRVSGESMIDAGIFDGDTVIFDPREPRHNDIVAALIDGATTLKRFINQPGCPPYLKAENPAFPEIHPVSELIVQGVAKAVVRRL